MPDIVREYGPGLTLLIAIALAATVIAGFLPPYIGAVFIAVVLGVVIANTVRLDPMVYDKGIRLGLKKFLKIAIVLLGAGITFQEILDFGVEALAVIVVLIAFVFASTFALGKILGISLRKMLLIAVGVSICGNTAVATTAPLIDARDNEVAMAVGIVTLFGILGVVLYPFIGMFAGMSDLMFGFWAGTAINDTSQVVAAGFIFSDEAGKIATTIKLSRNVMIVPVVLLAAFFYARKTHRESQEKTSIVEIFPTFVLGFVALALLNSMGLIPEQLGELMVQTSSFLILLALSGIGLGVNFQKFTKIGWKPFILGFSVELLLAVVALALIALLVTGGFV